ncbi:unnamed protein product [Rhizoctonia solani]|uniref:Uncharacterized protein n=1 Tax=Rhizoctonia solani TaxID=456999 RepID=A0A8H2WLC1_9AGAM|nr:unnamed protein product [Rhizoctonia solani]
MHQNTLEERLLLLRHLLEGLPSTLPEPDVLSYLFLVDSEDVEDDIISPSPVLPPAQEISKVEATLPRKEPPAAKFVFSIK